MKLNNFLSPHIEKCTKKQCECSNIGKHIFENTPIQLILNNAVYLDSKKCPAVYKEGICQKVLKILLTDFETSHGRNDEFSILLAEAHFYYLANFYYACQELSAILLRKPSFFIKQRIYNLYRVIDMEMGDPQKDPDRILSAIDYVEHYNSFLEQLEDSAELTAKFWNILLSEMPSSQELNELGRRLFSAKTNLMKTVDHISGLTSNQLEFLIRYGLFLKYVMQDAINSDHIFKRICNITETIESNFVIDNKFSMFRPGVSVMLIIASIDSLGITTITEMNSNVEKILGYTQQDLIGFSASRLMSSTISQIHEKSVQDFFQTMIPKCMGMHTFQLVRRNDGLFAPCEIKHKIVPRLSDGIQVSLLLVQDRTISFYTECKPGNARRKTGAILCDHENKIIGISKEFAELMQLSDQDIKGLTRGISLFEVFPQFKSFELYAILSEKEGGVITINITHLQATMGEVDDFISDGTTHGRTSSISLNGLYWIRILTENYVDDKKSVMVLVSEIPDDFSKKFIPSSKITGLYFSEFVYDHLMPDTKNAKNIVEMQKDEDRQEEFSLVESVAGGSVSSERSGSRAPDTFNKFASELRLHNLSKSKTPSYIIRLYVVIILLLVVISTIISIF